MHPSFGAQLSGNPASTFLPITGSLDLRVAEAAGTEADADILSSVDLEKYYNATTDSERIDTVQQLLEYRGVSGGRPVESALYDALSDFGPMKLLINSTMKQAQPIGGLGRQIFPNAAVRKGDSALTTLMALGSVAREEPNTPGVLPCRIHNFFRGLPGLWVCMDPDCSEAGEGSGDGICGKMYGQPRELCQCGSRVLELYTCRNCGTAYARAYSDDALDPTALWAEPGHRLRMASGDTEPLSAIDLLLEDPPDDESAEIADYDLETGRLNPPLPGQRMRSVFIRDGRVSDSVIEGEEALIDDGSCAQFVKCAVCKKTTRFGRSYVQDHQTKGDQPFQALVSRQVQIQPPAPVEASSFAPLQGRKVLTFSDSRQVAARLAPNLQLYSDRDSLRPLIAWGYRRLQGLPSMERLLNLDDLYLSVLLAAKRLNVRLRPEIKSGESFSADRIVESAVENGVLDDDAALLGLCMELRSETAAGSSS